MIASEDAGFIDHDGVDWEAIEKAWAAQPARRGSAPNAPRSAQPGRAGAAAKLVGGSTITQQLAKNLLLSGERTLLRKGQELVLTLMLEALLSQAAHPGDLPEQRRMGRRRVRRRRPRRGTTSASDAARLGADEAARLAVMLPAPKRFEKRPGSAYVVGRAATIVARMGAVELP